VLQGYPQASIGLLSGEMVLLGQIGVGVLQAMSLIL